MSTEGTVGVWHRSIYDLLVMSSRHLLYILILHPSRLPIQMKVKCPSIPLETLKLNVDEVIPHACLSCALRMTLYTANIIAHRLNTTV